MDFGIAAVAGAPALTAPGEVVGTLAYMAPEQAEGYDAGPEADVYSLALTLYEAWAGENPVARRTPAQTARQIGQPMPSLAVLRPDLPNPLVAQIDACLDARPSQPADAQAPSLRARARCARSSTTSARSRRPMTRDSPLPRRSFARIFGLVGAGTVLAALAGPAGLPGLALVAGRRLPARSRVCAQRRHSPCFRSSRSRSEPPARSQPPRQSSPSSAAHRAGTALILGGLSFAAYSDRGRGLRRRRPAQDRPAGRRRLDVVGVRGRAARSSVAFADPSALGGIAVLAAAAVPARRDPSRPPGAALWSGTILWAACPRRRPRLRRRRLAERKRCDRRS